jgi:hypothetical protein
MRTALIPSLVVLLASVAAVVACGSKGRTSAASPSPISVPELFKQLESHARTKNTKERSRSELRLLLAMRRYPYSGYHLIEKPLLTALAREGVGPFTGIALEHVYRLRRVGTPAAIASLQRLKHALGRAKRVPAAADDMVWLRTADGSAFKPYSANVARAAMGLMLSGYGQQLIASVEATPESFVRYTGLYLACKDRDNSTSEERRAAASGGGTGKPLCDDLRTLVEARLEGGRNSDFQGGIKDISKHGVIGNLKECVSSLTADDFLAESMDRLDSFIACEGSRAAAASQLSRGSSFDATGLMRDSPAPTREDSWYSLDFFDGVREHTRRYWKFEDSSGDEFEVWEHVDEHEQTRFEWHNNTTGESGLVKTGADGFMEKYEWGDGQGNSYEAEYNDGSNTLKRERIVEKEGNTETTRDVTYDKKGNKTGETVTTKTTNPDGTTTTTTTQLDANGNVVTPATTPATGTTNPPRGEPQADPCFDSLTDTPTETDSGRDLGPWIIPLEGQGQGAIDACFDGMSNARPTDCRSAMLCVDGYVDGECNCVNAGSGSSPPVTAAGARCAKMTCAEGTCDPSTGTCTSGAGDYTPGVPPLPNTGGLLDVLLRGTNVAPKAFGGLGIDDSLREPRRVPR